jgi:hypothetical protein
VLAGKSSDAEQAGVSESFVLLNMHLLSHNTSKVMGYSVPRSACIP